MRVLITGGCGFIGTHATEHFIKTGHEVHVMDDFSRAGTRANYETIKTYGKSVCHSVDIRNYADVTAVFAKHKFDVVLHLAGQTAVTLSVQNPLNDFAINAAGTLHLLEAARRYCPDAPFLYSSTNKVYGSLEGQSIVEKNGRYAYGNGFKGIPEESPLDFHSPYGCSKGVADQYVRDYARIYGMKTVVFRQSCIYGTQQYGVEDQGWVAWFSIAGLLGFPLTIYGDGKQVRDVLYVGDLVGAFQRSIERIDKVKGEIFNVGGGPKNSLSLLELVAILEKRIKGFPKVDFGDWRPGDQKVCIMDIGKAEKMLGWTPKIDAKTGIEKLITWIEKEQGKIAQVFGAKKAA